MRSVISDILPFWELAKEKVTLEKCTTKKQGRPQRPGVQPTDPMSEAGRKVLRFHFLRMLDCEAGTRAGEDIEEVHDMRVATRRMRAAFQVFGPYFEAKTIAPFVKGLRRTARLLGAARDLDVLIEKAREYQKALSEEEQPSLAPLLSSWQTQREEKRQSLLSYLDSARYRGFCQAFGAFLAMEEAGASPPGPSEPLPSLVAHVAPQAIYQRLAAVRSFEPALPGASVTTLHALRISCKRLRYTLEFFAEVLGPEAQQVIKDIVAMQDHLGALQDAVVASDLLLDFLNDWTKRQKSENVSRLVEIHGVANYFAAKQREIHALLAAFPAAWQRLNAPEWRQNLAAALAVL